MSAAEKLRKFESSLSPSPWGRYGVAPEWYTEDAQALDLQGVQTLRNALPQIVAVVEAAEEVDRLGTRPSLEVLAAALAALDGALS